MAGLMGQTEASLMVGAGPTVAETVMAGEFDTRGGHRTLAAYASSLCRDVESRHLPELETGIFSAVSQGNSEPFKTGGEAKSRCKMLQSLCEREHDMILVCRSF
jgi:hypothetical protein